MSTAQKYGFEVFALEPDDIKSDQALIKALGFSAQLWNDKEPKEGKDADKNTLFESDSKIKVRAIPINTDNILTDFVEYAVIVKAESENFDELEAFRRRLLKHLKGTLKFKHIRVLRDDISTHISNALYPAINIVESMLRRYLVKFFIQRVGVEWWEVSAAKNMIDKVAIRVKDRRDEYSNYINTDVEYADFDDLGELIYKQSSGFNQPEHVLAKLVEISTIEDLDNLKADLQGNYTKYFKEFFQDKRFKDLWTELFKIRNKVAHHGTFFKHEMDKGLEMADKVKEIILAAEKRIDDLVFTIEEKEALRTASIEALSSTPSSSREAGDIDVKDLKYPQVKIVGRIDLPVEKRTVHGHDVIDEQTMIEELEKASKISTHSYVGLKWFVTNYLASQNYSIPFSYSLINIMADRGTVTMYDVPTPFGHNVKAIEITPK